MEISVFLLRIALIQNPLSAQGRIIHCWKGISEGNTRLIFTDLDPEGELAFISLPRPSDGPVGDVWIPWTFPKLLTEGKRVLPFKINMERTGVVRSI